MARPLHSDSLQFAQMFGSVVVRSVLSGGDLVIVGFIDRISYIMVSRREINTMKDLAGKKIATASIDGSVDSVLRLGLKDPGVDPRTRHSCQPDLAAQDCLCRQRSNGRNNRASGEFWRG